MLESNHPDQMEELLVKYLTGMADAEERDTVRAWIAQSEENQAAFERLKLAYIVSKTTQPDAAYDTEKSWNRVKDRHYQHEASQHPALQKKQPIAWNTWLKYAAGIAFIFALGILTYRSFTVNRQPVNVVWNTVEAPYGSRSKVTLADGTQVWLNAGSELKYASSFGFRDREVYLSGEAYFSVTHSKKQFVVNTSYIDVRVHGTEFNVKAYKDEDYVQTTLVKGSVSMIIKYPTRSGKHKIPLKPNQTATFNILSKGQGAGVEDRPEASGKGKPAELEVATHINPVLYTSWKDTKWLIEGERLSSLAKKLERRYNVIISFESKSLEKYRFTGTLTDETLDQVLHVIQLSAPIRYEINDHKVSLFENEPAKDSYDEMLIRK
jgi:transmembrane sensor